MRGGRAFYPLPGRDAGANTAPAKGGNPTRDHPAQALMANADRLLATPPQIDKVDLLAAK
jgi:hypothetical protein